MRLKTGGMTAAAVLIIGITGGVIGGAMTASPVPAAPPAIVQHVAEEAVMSTPTPSAEPVATEAPAAEPVESPTPAPARVVVVQPVDESATDAADRAQREANRAEKAAERAEVASTPEPEPVVTPEPKPECAEGDKRSDPYIRDGQTRTRRSYTCVDGAWKHTGNDQYRMDGGSDVGPPPVATKPTQTSPVPPKVGTPTGTGTAG